MNLKKTVSNSYYKDIFDVIKDALVILNLDHTVDELNDTAQELFQISRKKAKSHKSGTFLPEEIDKLAYKSITEDRYIQENEIECRLKNRGKLLLDVTAVPFYCSNVSSEKILVQIRDTTWNKHITQKNIQASTNLMFENLILGLSHELKNPLSGIKGAAQLLASEENLAQNSKIINIIVKEIDRLNTMLDNFTQLEVFTGETYELLDIHELLTEITLLEEKSMKANKVLFINDYDVTIPRILGDFNSLKQAFLNIIKNAIEATPENGKIEIITRWNTDYKLPGESEIIVEIRDNGIGIEKKHLDKIFTPFYTSKTGGTGLGLFYSQQIINKHNGAIYVKSEPNAGTSFIIYLPVVKISR